MLVGFRVAGDYDGNGTDTVGLFDQSTSNFYLRNSNSSGVADVSFHYGTVGWGAKPVIGDWNGVPTPVNDTYSINEDTATTFNVVSNDTSPIGRALKPTHCQQPLAWNVWRAPKLSTGK